LGEEEGFVKVVSEKKYDEILGVHIIGPHATELIAKPVSDATRIDGRRIRPHDARAPDSFRGGNVEAPKACHDLAIHI